MRARNEHTYGMALSELDFKNGCALLAPELLPDVTGDDNRDDGRDRDDGLEVLLPLVTGEWSSASTTLRPPVFILAGGVPDLFTRLGFPPLVEVVDTLLPPSFLRVLIGECEVRCGLFGLFPAAFAVFAATK